MDAGRFSGKRTPAKWPDAAAGFPTSDTNGTADKAVRPHKSESKQKSFSDIFSKFALSTSAHGFCQLDAHRRAGTRLFWVCVLVVSFAGLGVHLFALMEQYLRFQYKEVTEMVQESPHFPDVTVCNLDGISSDRFVSSSKLCSSN